MNLRQLVHIWWADVFPKEHRMLLSFAEWNIPKYEDEWVDRFRKLVSNNDPSVPEELKRLRRMMGGRVLDTIYQPMPGDGVALTFLNGTILPATVLKIGDKCATIQVDKAYPRKHRTLYLVQPSPRVYDAKLIRNNWQVMCEKERASLSFGRNYREKKR